MRLTLVLFMACLVGLVASMERDHFGRISPRKSSRRGSDRDRLRNNRFSSNTRSGRSGSNNRSSNGQSSVSKSKSDGNVRGLTGFIDRYINSALTDGNINWWIPRWMYRYTCCSNLAYKLQKSLLSNNLELLRLMTLIAGQTTTSPGNMQKEGSSQGAELPVTAESWATVGMLWLSLVPVREATSTA